MRIVFLFVTSLHMDKIGNGKVQCRLCQKQLTYAQGGSTTSLRLHLHSLHPSVTDVKVEEQAQRPLSAFGVEPQRPSSLSAVKTGRRIADNAGADSAYGTSPVTLMCRFAAAVLHSVNCAPLRF